MPKLMPTNLAPNKFTVNSAKINRFTPFVTVSFFIAIITACCLDAGVSAKSVDLPRQSAHSKHQLKMKPSPPMPRYQNLIAGGHIWPAFYADDGAASLDLHAPSYNLEFDEEPNAETAPQDSENYIFDDRQPTYKEIVEALDSADTNGINSETIKRTAAASARLAKLRLQAARGFGRKRK